MRRFDFGLCLRQKRRQLKLNVRQLGDILGVSRQTISNWERNVTVPDENNLCILQVIYGLKDSIIPEQKKKPKRILFLAGDSRNKW